MRHSRKTLSASTIMDFNVENSAGESLGTIEDVMVDLDEGCVAYAVLSFGGFLGFGDKLFAIPWSKLTPSPDKDETFILDVPKEKLQEMQGFDKNNWPDFSDPQWRRQTYDYYGAKHYWEEKV
ncbi:MAG: PRC-barrel domain-containing protein [Deltaproteobacteria bacterium]|nr:PRC-barrel domain-containing protein [Deltaproteobacteria bacterium]